MRRWGYYQVLHELDIWTLDFEISWKVQWLLHLVLLWPSQPMIIPISPETKSIYLICSSPLNPKVFPLSQLIMKWISFVFSIEFSSNSPHPNWYFKTLKWNATKPSINSCLEAETISFPIWVWFTILWLSWNDWIQRGLSFSKIGTPSSGLRYPTVKSMSCIDNKIPC
jgi:hypothetical protein